MAEININALKSEIREAVINRKANACPMVVRLAWHSSGTFDKNDSTGGSDGATMRFSPEKDDDANAGLSIIRDLLLPVKLNHPEISYADLWTLAGTAALEFLGGPPTPFKLGRSDAADGSACCPIGRLPDAAQGAQHLRDVFYRMGFNDQEIVALSGAHTLGRCHKTRSGFDGPWTNNPLKFDNQYFKVLLNMDWEKRKWDGPEQFEDQLTGNLMMLPTDLALKTDEKFLVWVKKYAADEQLFFDDFGAVFGKLLALGCPASTDPSKLSGKKEATPTDEFLEHAMHGSLERMQRLAVNADVNGVESSSGRTALHKAAYWGHDHVAAFLTSEKAFTKTDSVDYSGETALHDASRFGHVAVVKVLIDAGANTTIKNKDGKDALTIAQDYSKPEVAKLIQSSRAGKL